MWREFIFDEDFDNRVRGALNSGQCYYDHDRGLIFPQKGQMNYDSNWLFFGYTVMSRDCYLWHSIMFTHFDFVPEFCKMRCYKVVVKPRNVKELIQWHGVASGGGHCVRGDICPLSGKAGIDTRHYTNVPYDSFFYCDGLEDGLKKYAIVRNMCDTMMEDGKNIEIILKRSCTEFERKYGSTDGEWWQQFTEEELQTQRRLEDIFVGRWEAAVQPDWQKNKTILRWLQHANAIGDTSWIDYYNKGDFLTCKPTTYHHLLAPPEEKVTPAPSRKKQKKKGGK